MVVALSTSTGLWGPDCGRRHSLCGSPLVVPSSGSHADNYRLENVVYRRWRGLWCQSHWKLLRLGALGTECRCCGPHTWEFDGASRRRGITDVTCLTDLCSS